MKTGWWGELWWKRRSAGENRAVTGDSSNDDDDDNNKNVRVQNILNRGNNITCSTDCKYRTAATLYM